MTDREVNSRSRVAMCKVIFKEIEVIKYDHLPNKEVKQDLNGIVLFTD